MAERTKAYTWSLISYATMDELQNLLDNCLHYAYCHHDKDSTEDGELKEPHTHILVKFEQQKTLEQIKTLINSQQNTLGQCQQKVNGKDGKVEWRELNITALYRYLIHTDNKEKFQYEAEERITDNPDYWSKYSGERYARDKSDSLIEDLLKPYKSRYELDTFMSDKYGRDYVKNRIKYLDFRDNMIAEEIASFENFTIDERFQRYNKLITFLETYEISPQEAYSIIFNNLLIARNLHELRT